MRCHFLIAGTIGLGLCLCQLACTGKPKGIEDKVPLTPVTGKISVDGAPTAGVMLQYVPNGEIAEKRPQYVKYFVVQSSADGTFALKTYAQGDGVPAGEYRLYCQYFASEGEERRRDLGEDALGGKYFPPHKPARTFTAKLGEPLDLGTIEVKSAPKKRK
jgi:hypothetical protein